MYDFCFFTPDVVVAVEVVVVGQTAGPCTVLLLVEMTLGQSL